MTTKARNDSQLNFRLSRELKELIEEAAATLGQSVSDFAIATLVRTARTVIQQRDVTELSDRDRDVFLAMLEDTDARPNKALADAARKYKQRQARSTRP